MTSRVNRNGIVSGMGNLDREDEPVDRETLESMHSHFALIESHAEIDVNEFGGLRIDEDVLHVPVAQSNDVAHNG